LGEIKLGESESGKTDPRHRIWGEKIKKTKGSGIGVEGAKEYVIVGMGPSLALICNPGINI